MRCLVLLLLLAACSRPLSDAERSFSASVHGPALATQSVRFHRGNLIGGIISERPARPAKACRERIRPPETGSVQVSTAAIVLFNRVFFATDFWSRDYLAPYPDTLPLEEAMFIAHELTHVWQWQQREQTGYHPWKAAAEHAALDDPYLFELGDRSFGEYGYEQQGGLVEEFVCCRALDPNGARTQALHDLLAPVFPGLDRRERARTVHVRWSEVETDGICS